MCRRVSEAQSITLLCLCPSDCCTPPLSLRRRSLATVAQRPSAGHHHSRSAASASGRHAPLVSSQQHQLMRESSPVASVHRLRAADWNTLLPHELQRPRLREVDGRGDDDRYCAGVVLGALAGSVLVSTSGTVLTS